MIPEGLNPQAPHSIENKAVPNGTPIAHYESASDELRLPDYLRSAVRPQAPGKSNRHGADLKQRANRPGQPESGTVATIHRPADTWEASDSPERRSATPQGVAFVSMAYYRRNSLNYLRYPIFSAPGPKPHLPPRPLRCSIRFAYHAADVSPRMREVQARRRAHTSPTVHSLPAARVGRSHRKGIT